MAKKPFHQATGNSVTLNTRHFTEISASHPSTFTSPSCQNKTRQSIRSTHESNVSVKLDLPWQPAPHLLPLHPKPPSNRGFEGFKETCRAAARRREEKAAERRDGRRRKSLRCWENETSFWSSGFSSISQRRIEPTVKDLILCGWQKCFSFVR